MSTPEALIAAIRERIAAGHDEATIKAEALAAGHSEPVYAAAYTLAKQATSPDPELPTAIELWKRGLAFVREEWILVLLVSLPAVVFAVVEAFLSFVTLSATSLIVINVVKLLFHLFYVIASMALLRYATIDKAERNAREALVWVRKHFLVLIWTYFLIMAAIFGGLLLFIVPGIIAFITLYFAVYAVAYGEAKGEGALTKSRQVVAGRLGIVVSKLFGFFLCNFAVLAGLAIVGSIFWVGLESFVPMPYMLAGYDVVTALATTVLSAILMYASAQLYVSLRDTASADLLGTYRYRGLILFGLLVAAAAVAFISYFGGYSAESLESGDRFSYVKGEIVSASAAGYPSYSEDGTYSGVCELLSQVSFDSINDTHETVCNDSAEAWAVSYTSDLQQWCVDSAGYNKSLPTELGERTSCLPL